MGVVPFFLSFFISFFLSFFLEYTGEAEKLGSWRGIRSAGGLFLRES
jgi:hypothetical protein